MLISRHLTNTPQRDTITVRVAVWYLCLGGLRLWAIVKQVTRDWPTSARWHSVSYYHGHCDLIESLWSVSHNLTTNPSHVVESYLWRPRRRPPGSRRWRDRGKVLQGGETCGTLQVVEAAPFHATDKQTNKQTDKQTNRRTSPSHKVPSFVAVA